MKEIAGQVKEKKKVNNLGRRTSFSSLSIEERVSERGRLSFQQSQKKRNGASRVRGGGAKKTVIGRVKRYFRFLHR